MARISPAVFRTFLFCEFDENVLLFFILYLKTPVCGTDTTIGLINRHLYNMVPLCPKFLNTWYVGLSKERNLGYFKKNRNAYQFIIKSYI